MIYVYDIILNWSSEEIYEFFEWELNDDIEHIKKMPFFKINNKSFNDFLNYEIKVDKLFLDKINNLTALYTVDQNKDIKYASLFTDGIRVIAIQFDNNGKAIYRSGLLLDEEQDIVMLSNKLMETSINYSKGRKLINSNNFITRHEKEVRHLLKIEIENCYQKGNLPKLQYLYYECFGKEIDDINLMYQKLLESISNKINNNHNKLYEVLKLSYQNKN